MMDVDTLNSAVERMWLRIRHDESDRDSRGILAEVVVQVWEGGKLPKQENLVGLSCGLGGTCSLELDPGGRETCWLRRGCSLRQGILSQGKGT